MKYETEMAIIGGGPGGYVSAIRAAQGGMKVLLIEKEQLGGTCLNRGCIPTKTLVHAAEVIRKSSAASAMGIRFGEITLDMPALHEHKNAIVESLRGGILYLLNKNKVEIVQGKGSFLSSSKISVKSSVGGHMVRADNVIVAAGSIASPLQVQTDGQVTILNSEQALDLAAVPKSMLIVGGGAIGIEFAGIFNSFGCSVVLVEMLPFLLPTEDQEMTGQLRQIMEQDGIIVYTEARVKDITALVDGSATVKIQLNDTVVEENVAVVLSAVGRRPNTDGLGLEQAGIITANGWIVTDEKGQTSISGVYAVGDITGQGMLAHTAMESGIRVADRILGRPEAYNPRVLPRCVFYQTEYAAVGATEEQLVNKGIRYSVGRFPFNANGKALSMGESMGMVKVLAEVDTGAILGTHILGPQASTLISQAGLGLTLEATLEEYACTVHAHPTISEAMQEACLAALGQPIHSP